MSNLLGSIGGLPGVLINGIPDADALPNGVESVDGELDCSTPAVFSAGGWRAGIVGIGNRCFGAGRSLEIRGGGFGTSNSVGTA